MSEDIKKSNLVAPEGQTPLAKKYGLLIALAVLVAVLLMPMPAGLSVAGHRIVGNPAFRSNHLDHGSRYVSCQRHGHRFSDAAVAWHGPGAGTGSRCRRQDHRVRQSHCHDFQRDQRQRYRISRRCYVLSCGNDQHRTG